MYEVATSELEKSEKVINEAIRKWLGVPRCVSTVALYGKRMLDLPMTSLVEEFKCGETSLEMTLSQSKDPAVKNTAQMVKTGKKWNPREAVQHAQGAIQYRDIIEQVQSGRAGFGLGLDSQLLSQGAVKTEAASCVWECWLIKNICLSV